MERAFTNVTPADFPIAFDLEWIAADGAHRLIAWWNTCLTDDAGAITHVVAAGTDITERREALAQASTPRARSRSSWPT